MASLPGYLIRLSTTKKCSMTGVIIIINCYKGNGDSLGRHSDRSIKLLDRVMKVILIRKRVSRDKMQFDFAPGRGTTDAIFLVRQLQK